MDSDSAEHAPPSNKPFRESHNDDMVVECGYYPIGFGHYLTQSHARFQRPDTEPALNAILSISDFKTKNKLLCFLDDFLRREYILKSYKSDRKLLFIEIHDIMVQSINIVKKAFLSFHDAFTPAVEASAEVYEMCESMLQAMFDLYSFHAVSIQDQKEEEELANIIMSDVSIKYPIV